MARQLTGSAGLLPGEQEALWALSASLASILADSFASNYRGWLAKPGCSSARPAVVDAGQDGLWQCRRPVGADGGAGAAGEDRAGWLANAQAALAPVQM